MTRAVQLGVAAVHSALALAPGWQDIPPERRGLFVGASPQAGDAEDLAPVIAALRAEGVTTLRGIAAELNARGMRTRRGGTWQVSTVANLTRRIVDLR